MEEVKWGIIGVGNVTELKSGPAFNKAANSRLVAVMRRNASLAEDYAVRHGVPRWYSDADALIGDPEVSAVYVATPPYMHAKYAIRAMEAGKPVYVEKPMAMNYRECKDMLRISASTGAALFVAYYRRTLPAFLKVRDLIAEGEIGTPLTVSIRLIREAAEQNQQPGEMSWHVNPEIGGAGHFFDLASHQLDFLDFLFGPITEAKGIAVNQAGLYPAEDTVSGTFIFENGVTGTGSWCFVAHTSASEDVIEIVGTGGSIAFSTFQHGDVVLKNRLGIHKYRLNNPENIQQFLIQNVVDSILGKAEPVSTGESGARTSAVMDEMVKGYYTGRDKRSDRTKGSCRIGV